MADSTKLQLNTDGTVTIPLKARDAIVLQEPSVDDLGWMLDRMHQADEKLTALPTIPEIPANASQEMLNEAARASAEFLRVSRLREGEMYGTDGSRPYLDAFLEMVAKLNGAEVTTAEVYGWVLSPNTMRRIFNHFTAPLGGEGVGR